MDDRLVTPGSFLLISLIIPLAALDQWTKHLAAEFLRSSALPLIPGVLELRYVENTGAAFGLLGGKNHFFIAVTLIVCIYCFLLFFNCPRDLRFLPLRLSLTMLISGALGNFLDRIRLGYVVDFIYFRLIDFPVFNVADILVTCSVFALMLLFLIFYNDDDMKKLRLIPRHEQPED